MDGGSTQTQRRHRGMEAKYVRLPQEREHDGIPEPTDPPKQPSEVYGYMLILTSVAFYSTMRVCMRRVTAYDGMAVSATMLLWGVTQVTLGLLLALYHGVADVFKVTNAQLRLLTLRAVFGAASLCMLQNAVMLLPVATATAVFFLNPVFTLAIGRAILHEPVAKMEIGGAALSLVGAVLVACPSNNADFRGLFAGLAAAVLAACAYVSLRAAVKDDGAHYVSAVLAFGVAVTIAGVGSGGIRALLRTRNEILSVAVLGSVAGFLAMCALSAAYQYCRAGTGAVLRKADVPLVFVLGAVVLKEIPTVLDVVGSTFIVGGTVIVGSVPFCIGVTKSDVVDDVAKSCTEEETSAV